MKIIENVRYAEHAPCLLDMYLPESKRFKTVVDFHGGGLEAGDKGEKVFRKTGAYLAEKGAAFIAVNYRMYPEAKFPDFIEDAAKAVAYIARQIASYGGSGEIYVAGHSAGAYLTLMLCLDKRYLLREGVNGGEICGWLSDSAQTTVHFNVLRERGEDSRVERLDDAAPLFFSDGNAAFSKLLLLSYEDDMPCRLTQNRLLCESLRRFGKENVRLKVLKGVHTQACLTDKNGNYPIAEILLRFIEE